MIDVDIDIDKEMEITPIEAKIVSVSTFAEEGIISDEILINFHYENSPLFKDFESPMFDAENMRTWRRLVLSVVSDKKIPENDPDLASFATYKKAILNKDIYVAYDGQEIYGMGKNPKNMFFPEAYDLWASEDSLNI